MAMNNELLPQVLHLQVGTQAASISLPGMKVLRDTIVKRVSLINQVGLAADDTNYLQVQLVNIVGDVVLAEVSSKLTGGEGSLVANAPLDDTATAALLAAGTPLDLPAGTVCYVKVIKNGTGAPTLAQLELEMYSK
jgi:hypothetical protein